MRQLPDRYKQTAIDKLSVELPLAITARLLEDNGYWQKCFAVRSLPVARLAVRCSVCLSGCAYTRLQLCLQQ